MSKDSNNICRIFLSYGHDVEADLAKQLYKDLELLGHKVWFDQERLTPGNYWEHLIEKGLNWVSENPPGTGRVVLLMTPHSTRRPMGYCLNEIHRALKKNLVVVPVMVVQCEPPLSICRIQYLDMRDCLPLPERQPRYEIKLQQLCNTILKDSLQFDEGHTNLFHALNPLPFEAEIKEHLEDFSGREWLIQEITSWLTSSDASRLFWLVAPPGWGKTALAVHLSLSMREIGAFHLCSAGHSEKANPKRVIMSLVYQLSTQLPDYLSRLKALPLDGLVKEANAETLFDRLFVQPLSINFPQPDRTIVMLIDALDEASQGDRNYLAELLAKHWHRTPRWLRMIITSRPEAEVIQPLQAYSPYKIDSLSQENEQDISTYLEKNLKPFIFPGVSEAEIIASIKRKSEGIFLYAHFILRELEAKHLSLHNLDNFPQSLGGYYHSFWQRAFPDENLYDNQCRPLLELVAASREPLHKSFVIDVLNWRVINLIRTSRSLGSLLIIEGEKIRPFHRSMLDWATDESKAGIYHIDIKEGHQRLANHGLAQYHYYNPKANDKTKDSLHSYYRRHLLTHLIALERWEEVKEVMTDPKNIELLNNQQLLGDMILNWRMVGGHLDVVQVYRQALEKFERDKMTLSEIANISQWIGNFMVFMDKYREAVFFLNFAWQKMEETLGPDSLETIDSLLSLAIAYDYSEKFEESDQLYHSCLEHLNRLQKEQPSDRVSLLLAKTLNNLSEQIRQMVEKKILSLDNYLLAEKYNRKSLNIRRQLLSEEHADTAESLDSLGTLCYAQDSFDKAAKFHIEALSIRECLFGPNHILVADTLTNLADDNFKLEQLEEAEELYLRAKTIYEGVKGTDCEDYADCLDGLGRVYHRWKQFQSAEALLMKALEIYRNKRGTEDIFTQDILVE